ncbi:hypothetical protein HDU88_007858 [Geranomyces variabilis]|nr:hypothetical protein HDU88_007858 [Geranomyces variabilis]
MLRRQNIHGHPEIHRYKPSLLEKNLAYQQLSQQMLSIPCYERERVLQEHLFQNPPSGFPVLVAMSWKVAPPFSQLGEGDLVSASEDGTRYRVVETKALNPNPGRTAKTSRRNARRKVEEQVARYTKEWSRRHPNKEVSGCSFVGTTVKDAEFGCIYFRMDDDILDRQLRNLWIDEVTKGLTNDGYKKNPCFSATRITSGKLPHV